jgi:predicted Ser/Thr protein kinase/tetratricopeptide (TPR) repeat protein
LRRVGLDAVLSRALGGPRVTTRLGPYALDRKVGAGGMGVVFRATDERDGRPVAIKLLEHATVDLRTRFGREVRILRALAHPQIVRYFDDGVTPEGSPFLVMEWLDGRDLAEHMQAGPLPVADALRIAVAAARGLAAAHDAGILHRDVKPANLFLLAADDDVRVIDFGVARAPASEVGLTATGVLVGTPSYMAPEQLRGEHGPAADIWGLGVTLFEMLTGRLPFAGRDPGSVLLSVMNEPLPSLTALRPEAPLALELLLGRLLARDPALRPANMAAVVAELADVRAELRAAPSPVPAVSLREQMPFAATVVAPALEVPGDVDGAPIGRGRPFGYLLGVLAESLDDDVGNAVLVTAGPGLGRTHLLGAFESVAGARILAAGGRVAVGRGDGVGAPFSLLAALVRSAGADLPAERELLATLAHLHDAPGGRFADVHALADALRIAWYEVVRAWLDLGPVLVLVDDAHRADLASLRALGRAVSTWGGHRALLVATTPPGAPHLELSALFGAAGPVSTLELGPLRPAPMRRLAARWAAAGPGDREPEPETLDQCVARAAGHPGHLRVLLAHHAESVAEAGAVGLVWDRIGRLDADARRLLRAASLIGDRFELDLLVALLGGAREAHVRRLDALAALGFVRRVAEARGDDDAVYAFEGELVRVACRQLSTEADVVAGHAALAAALVARGGAAPERVARHLSAAGRAVEAAPYLLRAARAALAGGDDDALVRLVAGGIERAASADDRAEFSLLAAEGAFWEGRVGDATALAERAVEWTAPGSVSWLRAQAWVVTAAGQAGENARLRAVAEAVRGAPPPATPEARDARCIVLSRLVTQLSSVAPALFESLRAEVEAERSAGGLGPQARAWAWRASPDVPPRDFDAAIRAFTEAHAAHVEAADARSAAQMQLYLGSFYCWTGAWARAAEVVDDALRIARMLGAEYLETWAEYTRAKVLTERAPYEVTRPVLETVIVRSAQSPRIRAGARIYLSLAALRAGDARTAEAQARAVVDDPAVASLRATAVAALVRALLSTGEVAAASAHRDELEGAAARETVEFDALIRLALAELLAALGEADAASAARRSARAALESRALGLADPLRRSEFLHRPHLNAATMAATTSA